MIERDGHGFKVFDAHAHWSRLVSYPRWPVTILQNLLAIDEITELVREHWRLYAQKGWARKADLYVKVLDYYHIDRAVLLPVFAFDVKFSAFVGRKHPDRVVPYGYISPSTKKFEEQLAFIKATQFPGVKVHPAFGRWSPQVPAHRANFEKLLEWAQEQKAVVISHTGSHTYIRDFIPSLQAYPKVKFILGHSGLSHQVDQAIDTAIQCPNVYLEMSGGYYHFQFERALKDPAIGPERMLYGSDLPSLHPLVEQEKIFALPISEAERDLIFWENMNRLLKDAPALQSVV